MQNMLTFALTSLLMLAIAAFLLYRSYGRNGSWTRSLGYGALFAPLLLRFGFGRYLEVDPWQVPLVTLAAAGFTGLLVYLLRLPRRFGPNPAKGDLMDMMVDGVIEAFKKQ